MSCLINLIVGCKHHLQAFKYVYDHHFEDADWFMKADDDTYVIMENLRYFLSQQDPTQPVFFGHRFKPFLKQGYPSGGAGYVMSKEALRRYGERGFGNYSVCPKDWGPEDLKMGRCMERLGVSLRPTVDVEGRSRFHSLMVQQMVGVNGLFPSWLYEYDAEGAKGVSSYAVRIFTSTRKIQKGLSSCSRFRFEYNKLASYKGVHPHSVTGSTADSS